MSLHPCLEKAKFLTDGDKKYIQKLAEKHNGELEPALREFQNKLLDSIEDIYKQTGVHEKPVSTEREQGQKVNENAPVEETKASDAPIEKYNNGDVVQFEHAGGERTGTIVGREGDRIKIKGSNGINYKIKEDAIREQEQEPPYAEDPAKASEDAEKKFKDRSGIAPVNLNPFVIAKSAWGMFNKAQELTFGAAFKGLESVVSRKINEGLKSRYSAVRTASQTFRNLIGGLPYQQEGVKNKLQFSGDKNWAHIRGKSLAEQWYKIVDTDQGALSRVHAAMDPGFYQNNPQLSGVKYSNLNASEKALFDQLRAANDFIHEWSYKNDFISKETYDARKGQYIGRFYEEFENLPPELRDAMKASRADFTMYTQRQNNNNTALEDPVYATAKRLTQVMQNQAIFDYAKSVANSKDIKVSSTEFPGSVQLGKPGDKPYYGALTGKYVPQYIAEDFKGFFYSNQAMQGLFDAFKWYDRLWIRQFLKKSHTVFDPVVQLGNAMTNFSFAFWAGVDPVTFGANLVVAGKELKTKGALFQEAVKHGLIGSDIMSGDLVPAAAKGTHGGLRGIYDAFDRAASGLYSGTDDLSKLSAYISFRNGGYTKEQAAQKVYGGFQNYATVGKSYDFASKTPIIGNAYIKFKPDLGRIMKNAISRRPLTAAIYLGAIYAMKEWLSQKSGEDENVKKIREGRNFIPKIPTPFGDIPLVWQVPGVGEVNFARFVSPFYQYDTGKSTVIGDVTDWLPYQMDWEPGGQSKDVPTPWIDMPDVLLGTYAQIAFDKDFRGKSIADPKGSEYGTIAVEDSEKWINRLNYASRSQVPFYRNVDDMLNAWRGKPDAYDRTRSVKQALINNILKVQQFGSEEAKNYIIKEVEYRMNQWGDIGKDITFLANNYEKEVYAIEKNAVMSNGAKEEAKKEKLAQLMRRIGIKIDEQQKIEKDIQDPAEMLRKFK